MIINIKLGKNFTSIYNKLQEKYGPEMARLNGFSDTQLSYTDYIDNFVDKEGSLADKTIDGNANARIKDICSLEKEMPKSHEKLLSFNKIFHELNKKYGFKVAKEWLEAEWNGSFYLHDAPSTSLKPYCYKGDEMLSIQYHGRQYHVSFIQLYDLIEEVEQFDSSISQNAKFPLELYVQDIVDEVPCWTKVTRVVAHTNNKPMRFIKYANGISQIVTEDHPVITEVGDIPAKEVTTEDRVYSVAPLNTYVSDTSKIEMTKELGWLLGMFLAEGNALPSQVFLKQNEGEQRDKLLFILNKYGVPYTLSTENKIYLRVHPIERYLEKVLQGTTSVNKQLPIDYMGYPTEFMDGVVAGLIDGDGTISGYKHRQCQIRIASEVLCQQISHYLQTKQVFCGSRTPHIYKSISGFTQKLPLFGIAFTLTNEEYFQRIGCIKIDNKYEPLMRKGDFKNKRYQYNYGWVNIIENSEYIDKCPVVYDITTETGHFVCNNILSHNCFAYDLDELAERGLFFEDEKACEPPQHLTTFVDFVGEMVSWASNRSSGAAGLPSLLPYLYYFWKKDVESNHYMRSPEYYRDQEFQRIIHKLNQSWLRGDQSAFTNVTIMDRPYLIAIFGGRLFPDGTPMIDHIEEMIDFQKHFMKVCSKIRSYKLMTFPVLTFSLLFQEGKFVDEEFARWASDHNCLWADSNFFIDKDVTSLSSCCRLVNDFSKLEGFVNSIGGTALKIGSVKVNTINLMRIAHESSRDRSKFLDILVERVHLCIKTLDCIRSIIKRNEEKGLLPNYTNGLIELDRQFNTIGINAMYEVIKHFGLIEIDHFGYAKYTEEGIAFASLIMDKINAIKDSYNFDYSINVEAVPGERCAVILCEKDALLFERGEEALYSNQWIPLTQPCSISEKVRLGSILDKKCGGGQISHICIDKPFVSESDEDPTPGQEKAWKLLNQIAAKGVIYFAFNTKINSCEHRHGFYSETCPICGKPAVDSWQRIVGFLTPVSSYSKERKAEFSKRDWFDLNRLNELN